MTRVYNELEKMEICRLVREQLDDILCYMHELTSWEEEFIIDMDEKCVPVEESPVCFSDDQIAKIREIHDRYL